MVLRYTEAFYLPMWSTFGSHETTPRSIVSDKVLHYVSGQMTSHGNICANFEELREMFLQLLYEHIREESRPRSHKEFLSRSLRQWDSASSGTLCSPLNFLCLLFVQCSLMCLLGQSFHS
ncbi:unnamed protein product [Musa acuminata subsp. malaccensis]|uniref:(wild Malaysian banana) hypothetical protein n=1 Tax=Musa acuminata subsp. malaccensis TaxID=214687 RepID=A0A8D7FAT1_MUSAM|nr:unnamed protein product [Musa acuminata subsp. malaccensis]